MTDNIWLKSRKGTFYSVKFPTLPSLTVKPAEVDLYQEKGSHDILELSFFKESQNWTNKLKTGTPVIFSWSQDGRKETWTGYVSHVSTQSAAQSERLMKVVCLGASYKLKERASRVWKNKSITEVAAQIAKEFKMSFVGEPSSRRFEQLSMSGESYLNWLQEHSSKIGYAFYVKNMTMYLRPLHKLLKESASNAPIMGMEPVAPNAGVKAWDRTLDSFAIKRGDYFDDDEHRYTLKTTAGVNPLTGKKLVSTSSPNDSASATTRVSKAKPLFKEYSKEVVHSSAFSKSTAKDLAFAAKFVTTAKARGQGDPRIRPYAAVFMYSTGSDTDGYWAVHKVHHLFAITGTYEVDMEVATDGIGPNSTATFRKANGLAQGTIDIESIMVNQLTGNTSPRVGTKLITKTPLIKETNQGFGNTNIFWSGN